MTAGENYFKVEFKNLLENYLEQNSTQGKEKGENFKCPDWSFGFHILTFNE